jgi:DNA-binding NtrC family response regulator
MTHVLIVDDEAAMRDGLVASFERHGWQTETASGVGEALEKFRMNPARVVVTDLRMGDGDGLQVMQGVRAHLPGTPVILLTAYGSVPGAVQAIREGACEYLQKPVSFGQLLDLVEQYLEAAMLNEEREEGIGKSPAFRAAVAKAKRAAATDVDILIEAESGTGKELLARLIHAAGKRNKGPFVAVNCSAFPENLLESELFGHVRGAFTGASTGKPGKFELANGGTLLLDEIGEMPLSLQPKLLRVLQEREVDRLGDTRPVQVDVRVIATTNRSLLQQVEAGNFRADLYYRLNVVPLTLPPLRERREDILPLAKHFVNKYADRDGFGTRTISRELERYLELQNWPGNVRELENFVRRALALSVGPVLTAPTEVESHFPSKQESAIGLQPGVTLQEAEKQLLERTLKATGGNRTRAAEMMGVSLRTVRNKIREYGLPAWRAT